jgi:phosphatidylglycerophosphate synthase
VDGTVAREFERPTLLGGILDLTLDRVVEAAVLLGLIWPHSALWLPAAVVLATWYVNITAFMATGAALGASEKLIRYPPGLVERTEVLFCFFCCSLSLRLLAHISAMPTRHSKSPRRYSVWAMRGVILEPRLTDKTLLPEEIEKGAEATRRSSGSGILPLFRCT